MITPLVLTLLAANEVNAVTVAAPPAPAAPAVKVEVPPTPNAPAVTLTAPPAPAAPVWSVQLSLAAPSIIGTSFALGPPAGIGLGGLGGIGLGSLGVSGLIRPGFANALTVERVLSERWTGAASLSFGASFHPSFSALSSSGVLSARFYPNRALEGFFAGPEVMFQLSTTELASFPGSNFRTYAGGAGARAGWLQRFGDHFLVSASAGLNASVSWTTAPVSSQTLNLGLDLALSAGLTF